MTATPKVKIYSPHAKKPIQYRYELSNTFKKIDLIHIFYSLKHMDISIFTYIHEIFISIAAHLHPVLVHHLL